jgi:polyhydroxyalkanoate synthesis regulator phasin
MRHRLFTLISQARHDLQLAEQIAKAEVSDVTDEDTAADLHEARARVLALEARVAAIEERSQE